MDLSKVDPKHKEIESFLGLGTLAPFQYERSLHETKIRFFWKRCLVWGLLLALLGWVGLATAGWVFVKYRRGFPEARYTHFLLLPLKIDDYRRSKGEYFLALGKRQFEEREYLTAFGYMRAGLSSVPEDTEARRRVSDLYLALHRPDLARPLMVEGLPYHADHLDYLQWVFASLFRFQEDDAVAQIAADFRAATPGLSPNARHILLMAEATAHYFRGRHERAEAVLDLHQTSRTQDGQLLLARIAHARGRGAEAAERLRGLLRAHPENLEAYVELVALLRHEGRPGELRRLALQRQIAFPEHPRAFLDELQQLHETGAEDALARGFESYLDRFARDASAMEGLASFVSNNGRVDFARRLYDLRATLPLPPGTAAICLIEAQLVAGRYAEAQSTIQLVTLIDHSLPDASLRGLDALRAVAFFAQRDILAAQGALLQYLAQPNLRPDLLVLTARRLEAVGARELALQALRKALEIDPVHQAAFNKLITLDPEAIRAEELRESLPGLLALRQPPVDLLRRLRTDLQSDRYLFFQERHDLIAAITQAGL